MARNYTLDEVRDKIESLGGKLLSTSYRSVKEKLSVQCSEGHLSTPTFDFIIQRNSFCRTCGRARAGKKKALGIEYCRKVAARYSGSLISETYIRNATPYEWRCKHGHEFKRTVPNIESTGNFCPRCIGHGKTIYDLRRIAEEKGGKVVSERFVNAKTIYDMVCDKGHGFKISGNALVAGRWCNVCRGSARINTLHAHAAAERRGGRFIAGDIENNRSKLKWRCANGHDFEATYHNVANHLRWCPTCKEPIFEIAFRAIAHLATLQDWPKVRPTWLTNPATASPLELDLYCEPLKCAIEIQGAQHRQVVERFKMTSEDLDERVRIDNLKQKICKERGVRLIAIDVEKIRTGKYDLRTIRDTLSKRLKDIEIPVEEITDAQLDALVLYLPRLEPLREAAKEAGYKLLDQAYLGMSADYRLYCSQCKVTWLMTGVQISRPNLKPCSCKSERKSGRQPRKLENVRTA